MGAVAALLGCCARPAVPLEWEGRRAWTQNHRRALEASTLLGAAETAARQDLSTAPRGRVKSQRRPLEAAAGLLNVAAVCLEEVAIEAVSLQLEDVSAACLQLESAPVAWQVLKASAAHQKAALSLVTARAPTERAPALQSVAVWLEASRARYA